MVFKLIFWLILMALPLLIRLTYTEGAAEEKRRKSAV